MNSIHPGCAIWVNYGCLQTIAAQAVPAAPVALAALVASAKTVPWIILKSEHEITLTGKIDKMDLSA